MKTYLLAVICIFTLSCGQLVPLNYNRSSNNRLLNLEYDSIIIRMEHIETKYSMMIMDVELINHSRDTLCISPDMIYFYTADRPFIPISDSYTGKINLAATKKNGIVTKRRACSNQQVDKLYRKKMEAKATVGVLLLVVGTGLSVYDEIKDKADSKKENWTADDQKKAIARDALVGATLEGADLVQQSLYKDAEDYAYLPYELFPERSIQPGEQVRGKVYLNKSANMNEPQVPLRYYRIVVPVRMTNYVFDFKKR